MGDNEKDAFYVVRKGDVIGVYKTFADCTAQAALSPLDPSISVYKGYGLSKEAESFLVSRGLKQASFSIGVSDMQDGIFGDLSVCPFQDVVGSNVSVDRPVKFNNCTSAHVSTSAFAGVTSGSDSSERFQKQLSCTIEFDGASKGNPGLAGAGAILRATNGSEVWRLREGVGIATNNVAEYRSVILGLRTALQKGYKHVRVRGDSLLVCNQEFNSDADALANRAIILRDGQVEMEVTH